MTRFICMQYSNISTIHIATFYNDQQEYELRLHKISAINCLDSSIAFPDKYIFSKNGCWEISFDLVKKTLIIRNCLI